MKSKPEKKNSGLNGIRTHDLYDTGAVLYQLSYQANWELVTLFRNIPMGGEEYKVNIWKTISLNFGDRYEDIIDHRNYTHNLSSCEIKAWKIFRNEICCYILNQFYFSRSSFTRKPNNQICRLVHIIIDMGALNSGSSNFEFQLQTLFTRAVRCNLFFSRRESNTEKVQDIQVINQAWGQDGWILAKFIFFLRVINRNGLVNKGFILWPSEVFFLRETAGSPSAQDRAILPSRVANHNAGFASFCQLTELAI